MADALTVDVEKRFASGTIVSATLRAEMGGGRVVVLFGPSGAGKTTIVRCIAGLERPDRGHVQFGACVWFDGASDRFVDPQKRGLGYVSQHAALFPHLTVRKNVGFAPASADRVDEMLGLLELADLADRYPRELSGGQAQRVALARAMAPRPRLLLLDEPFAGLDAPTRTRLRLEFRSIVQRVGISALLVTHDRTEAIAVGDEMAVLADGRIRQIGPVLEVFRRPADLVVAHSVGVESVLPAQVERVEQGLVDLKVGDVVLRAVDAEIDSRRSTVFACIRAEEVMLQRDAPTSGSARNHLRGRITSIDPEGPLERVTIDCGFPLVSLITRNAREEMNLAEGTTVFAIVKATSVHLV